jgi:MATE family multidrug resistance protein
MLRRSSLRRELKPLLALAAPLILAELGWNAMSVVDTVLVGRLPHSSVPMGAAAIAQVMFNVCTFGAGGVLLGLDTLISQAFGAREIAEANRWLQHGLVLATLVAAGLMALFFAGPYLLHFLPMDAEVRRQAIPAMQGLSWGALPLLLYFTLRRYLQAAHHARPIAFALVSANLVNAAGDWLLIFPHSFHIGSRVVNLAGWGVAGSSWSTSFSRFYMMLCLAAALLWADHRHGYGLRATRFRIEGQHMRRLLKLGSPAAAQVFVEVGIFGLASAIIATFGPLPLAGHEVALQCAATTFMVPFAISSATAVRVGHGIGRLRAQPAVAPRDAPAAAGWAGVLAGGSFMLLCAVMFFTFPRQIARCFTPDQGVIHAAVPLLAIAACFQFFDGLQTTLTGALRGAGNTSAPFLTQLICFWVVAAPLGALLAFHFHMAAAGVWMGLAIALAGAAMVMTFVWWQTTRRLAQMES